MQLASGAVPEFNAVHNAVCWQPMQCAASPAPLAAQHPTSTPQSYLNTPESGVLNPRPSTSCVCCCAQGDLELLVDVLSEACAPLQLYDGLALEKALMEELVRRVGPAGQQLMPSRPGSSAYKLLSPLESNKSCS